MARRRLKVSLRTVCKIGTIAHNKRFTTRDFVEYTGVPASQLASLKRRGIIKSVPGGHYPTARGWNVIERACRMRSR